MLRDSKFFKEKDLSLVCVSVYKEKIVSIIPLQIVLLSSAPPKNTKVKNSPPRFVSHYNLINQTGDERTVHYQETQEEVLTIISYRADNPRILPLYLHKNPLQTPLPVTPASRPRLNCHT